MTDQLIVLFSGILPNNIHLSLAAFTPTCIQAGNHIKINENLRDPKDLDG